MSLCESIIYLNQCALCTWTHFYGRPISGKYLSALLVVMCVFESPTGGEDLMTLVYVSGWPIGQSIVCLNQGSSIPSYCLSADELIQWCAPECPDDQSVWLGDPAKSPAPFWGPPCRRGARHCTDNDASGQPVTQNRPLMWSWGKRTSITQRPYAVCSLLFTTKLSHGHDLRLLVTIIWNHSRHGIAQTDTGFTKSTELVCLATWRIQFKEVRLSFKEKVWEYLTECIEYNTRIDLKHWSMDQFACHELFILI